MAHFEREKLTLKELARLAMKDQRRSNKPSRLPDRLISWFRSKMEKNTQTIDYTYHAVSIKPQFYCCASVEEIGDRRFLSAEAPSLPVIGCDRHKCKCKYIHHNDFRDEDRRIGFQNSNLLLFEDRRSGKDLRKD